MRDPSEVIAEMREHAEYEGPGLRALVRLWADELRDLATPQPASADVVDDAMTNTGPAE